MHTNGTHGAVTCNFWLPPGSYLVQVAAAVQFYQVSTGENEEKKEERFWSRLSLGQFHRSYLYMVRPTEVCSPRRQRKDGLNLIFWAKEKIADNTEIGFVRAKEFMEEGN